AKATGVTPDQHIDTTDSRFMMKLLQAIIRHENGIQPYSFEVFVKATELAGS
ncbi:structural protein, partial [Salmonella enterica subsp. enterica]|nr:structural protein [Salmonella enterica subsp. enterica]EDV0864061.1 structural protein [Salmonella enterica subsp. enterica]EDY0488830.1 structural protein [Salmonella enterica subsp. enterica]HCL4736991.1 structural protein [Salmonella enterica]